MNPQVPEKSSGADAPPARRSRWQRFSPSMGWPAFWSEIAIVVLGVVIALAANEAVESWNWRNRVADAEVRLQGDIDWAFVWSAERAMSVSCVDAQLAALSRKVLESGSTLDPQPVFASAGLQHMVRMPNRPYRFAVWESLLSDGTANHFSPRRQWFFGRVSDSMALSRAGETESRRLGGNLLVMRDAIALDPGVRAHLLMDINNLRSLNAYEGLGARQRMRLIADNGGAPDDATVERFLNFDGKHPTGVDYSGMPAFCKERGLPLGDWRDYRKTPVASGAPGQGGGK